MTCSNIRKWPKDRCFCLSELWESYQWLSVSQKAGWGNQSMPFLDCENDYSDCGNISGQVIARKFSGNDWCRPKKLASHQPTFSPESLRCSGIPASKAVASGSSSSLRRTDLCRNVTRACGVNMGLGSRAHAALGRSHPINEQNSWAVVMLAFPFLAVYDYNP